MSEIWENSQTWICPDLRPHWCLYEHRSSDGYSLKSSDGQIHLWVSDIAGYALLHFTNRYSVGQVQQRCQRHFGPACPPNLVVRLLQQLMQTGVLAPVEDIGSAQATAKQPVTSSCLQLRPAVEWIEHSDGYWILRNPGTVTHLQVSPVDKAIIEQLDQQSATQLAHRHQRSPSEIRQLVSFLALKSMLQGIDPPAPPKKKFNPLQLLYFKRALLNPDAWLERHVDKLRWIWQRPTFWLLCGFLSFTLVQALAQQPDIATYAQSLIAAYNWSLLLPFGVLAMAVVSVHELAHAFTLKHYGGRVAEMGLLFMCLIPAAYTETSDSYSLRYRHQAALVIGAGILCQIIIGALAFWLWSLSSPSSWFHTASFLLIGASLFTVLLNLNPMAKFDGYHLVSAASGINNLRARSFALYASLLQRKSSPESGSDYWLLLAYAPLSFLYLLLVFSRLALWLGDWVLTHIPALSLMLLSLWLIYYLLLPDPQSKT